MFAPLIEAAAPAGPHRRRSRGGDGRDHGRTRTTGADRRSAHRARHEGERPSEVVGLARTMRARATPLSRKYEDVFDTCGDRRRPRAHVQRLHGCCAGRFGVRRPRGKARQPVGVEPCGSADLFEAMGVNISAPPSVVEQCLSDANIAFFFAPTFHPSMRHAGPTRKELGVRTAFNLLGPLTNPAGATRQPVGVPRPELTELVAKSLGMLDRSACGSFMAPTAWTRSHDRLHEGVGVPGRRGEHLLSASA